MSKPTRKSASKRSYPTPGGPTRPEQPSEPPYVKPQAKVATGEPQRKGKTK